MTEDIKITLANGKDFGFENIDLRVLMNMDIIPRGYIFAGIKDDRFNLMSHSVLCAIIGAKYYDSGFLSQTFKRNYKRYYFITKCLFHDIQEVVTSDIPKPMKNDEHKEVENQIYHIINSWLGLEVTIDNNFKNHLKVVDLLSSLWETKLIWDKGGQEVRRVYWYRNKRLFLLFLVNYIGKEETYEKTIDWFNKIAGLDIEYYDGEVGK